MATINKILPSNFILEIVMIVLHGSTSSWAQFQHNSWIDIIDEAYMALMPIFLILTVVWIFYYKSHKCTRKARMLRGYQAGVLTLVGSLMLWTAVGTKYNASECTNDDKKCNAYEIRTVAGLLAIVDACLYLLKPVYHEPAGRSSPPYPRPETQVYMIQNDLPAYEAPPSYFDLPPEQQQQPVQEIISPEVIAVEHPPRRF